MRYTELNLAFGRDEERGRRDLIMAERLFAGGRRGGYEEWRVNDVLNRK